MRMRSRLIALLGLALLAVAPSAKAVNVLQFTQRNATTNKFTVVDNGAAPGSKIITTDQNGVAVFSIPILIGVLDDADVTILAWLRLENLAGGGDGLVSTSPVTPDTNAPGSSISQAYSGIIRINSAADMSGTNYLTAVINTGLLKGVIGEFAAGYQAAEPTDSIGFTSDVVSAAHMSSPRSVSLSFTGLSQSVNVTGPAGSRRFRTFRSNGTGTFSAAQVVPEPSTILLGGLGMLPLALAVRRRKEAVS
jgi:hypothetical protein